MVRLIFFPIISFYLIIEVVSQWAPLFGEWINGHIGSALDWWMVGFVSKS